MAAKVKLDIIEETRAEYDTARIQIIRTAFVYDMDPGPDIHIRAVRAPGIPRTGETHPYEWRTYVHTVRAVPVSDTQCMVQIIYETPRNITTTRINNPWAVRTSTTVGQESTQMTCGVGGNPFGVPIHVRYKLSNATSEDKDVVKVASVPRFVPQRVLQFRTTKQQRMPEAIHDVAGFVNARPWRGKPARTWLFLGPEEETQDSGRNFVITLTFWYRRRTWDEYAFYYTDNGEIPSDVEPQFLRPPPQGGVSWINGISRANVQNECDFNQMFNFLNQSRL